jgi:hypothetical protein
MDTTDKRETMTDAERVAEAAHARDLRSHGLTATEARMVAEHDTGLAITIADDLFAAVERGELTLEQADARIEALVAEAYS